MADSKCRKQILLENAEPIEARLDSIRHDFDGLYGERKFPISKSIEGKFLAKLAKETGQTEALAALAVFRNSNWFPRNTQQFYGAFAAMAFRQKISRPSAQAVGTIFDELQAEYEAEIHTLSKSATAELDGLKTKQADYTLQLDTLVDRLKK
jgi:hypothetical protein